MPLLFDGAQNKAFLAYIHGKWALACSWIRTATLLAQNTKQPQVELSETSFRADVTHFI